MERPKLFLHKIETVTPPVLEVLPTGVTIKNLTMPAGTEGMLRATEKIQKDARVLQPITNLIRQAMTYNAQGRPYEANKMLALAARGTEVAAKTIPKNAAKANKLPAGRAELNATSLQVNSDRMDAWRRKPVSKVTKDFATVKDFIDENKPRSANATKRKGKSDAAMGREKKLSLIHI